MKLLITGGTGFVGKNLIKILKGKHKIKLVNRKKENYQNTTILDLNDYNLVEKAFSEIDVIIHLAYSKNYPENIKIIKNIIKASKEKNIKKIILLSSMSAKRNNPDAYGQNKLEIENLIKKSKLNYTILRPSIIYGKGSTSFDFIINYLKKIPFFTPIIGNGKYKLSPVYIKDIIYSLEKCIKNEKTDKKDYDIVGGGKIYFIELINSLKKELKIKKRNIYMPIWFCKSMAIVLPKIISKENIKNLTEDSIANIGLAKKDFDYNPIKFKEGVKNGIL
jgi:NADH dehydrogenase